MRRLNISQFTIAYEAIRISVSPSIYGYILSICIARNFDTKYII